MGRKAASKYPRGGGAALVRVRDGHGRSACRQRSQLASVCWVHTALSEWNYSLIPREGRAAACAQQPNGQREKISK